MSHLSYSVLLVALATTSCAAARSQSIDEEPASTTEDAIVKKLPAPAVASQRLYFPNTSKPLPYLGGSRAWPYPVSGGHAVKSAWVFGVKGGSSFTINVRAFTDGEPMPAAPVALDAYYLYRGKWRHADAASDSGTASVALSPVYDHQWMVVASGDVGNDGNNLEIELACDSGADADGHSACALAAEPGDACTAKCDANLVCSAGTCAASTAACDPSVGFVDASVDVATLSAKTWQSADRVFTYTFAADGTFDAIFDACASSTCKIATQHATGHFSTKGPNVGLFYDGGRSTTLVHQRDCASAARLHGSDFGRSVDASSL